MSIKQASLSLCDLAIDKSIIMDGKKMGGVSRLFVDYDCNETVTKVTMTMCIKNRSLKIRAHQVSFETLPADIVKVKK